MDELADNLGRFGEVSRVEFPNTYRRPTRSLGAVLDLAQRRRIRRVFRELSPDVVHINQQVTEDGLDLLLAAHRSGIPFLSTIHIVQSAKSLDARFGRLRDLITRAVLKRVSTVHITVAERARQNLMARFSFLEPHQVKVVLNGVFFSGRKNARGHTRARWGATAGEIVIGTVGRLEAQKGPDIALQIIAGLVRKRCAVRYVWIGDGPMRNTFERHAQRLGIEGSVTLDGWRDDVVSCLQGLDIYLMPSRFEGMSLALLEAMAAGLCCCVSDVDGMAEAIQHGVNGYLCTPGDVARWCEQLEVIAGDASRRAEVGSRARDDARERFSVDGMASRTIGIYQDLMRAQKESRERKTV
jgi:glycosyltransferase involved in cell wall biosynthesis